MEGPVTADELVAFARALGETRPEYTEAGPALVAHPTYCVRFRGGRFYPEELLKLIDVRSGFDAGKDIQLGAPVRPGDTISNHRRGIRAIVRHQRLHNRRHLRRAQEQHEPGPMTRQLCEGLVIG